MFIHKKRGLLSLELALLSSLLLTILLFFSSLLYLIHIKEGVRNAISEAVKSYSTEVYIYSKLSQDLDMDSLSGAINGRVAKEIGLNLNLSAMASEQAFAYLIERKCYENLGFKREHPPFWLAGKIDVEVKARHHSLYLSTQVPIKLPVLSLFLKEIKLEVKNVEAARGAEKALCSDQENLNLDKGEEGYIVICAYSLNKKNPHPVYHDRLCFGRWMEKSENSITLDKSKLELDKNGDLSYQGRVYYYCKHCKSLRAKEETKDE